MKKYWIYFSTLILVIFYAEYDLAHRISEKNLLVQKDKLLFKKEKNLNSIEATENELNPDQILAQAQKISREESNPIQAEEKIEKMAHALTVSDILNFSALIEDTHEKSDNRSMAIELLARKKTNESLQILNKFIENHESRNKKLENVNTEFESVLRAQAIEGIASYPQKDLALSYLNSLSQKVSEAFLRERISKSEAQLQKPNHKLKQEQDLDLKKLIE